jgi:hypothetical protein
MKHPIPNLPPREKEIISPLGEIRKGGKNEQYPKDFFNSPPVIFID